MNTVQTVTPNLLGLIRLNPRCKICMAFGKTERDVFNAITQDIHSGRVSYDEIVDTYSKLLPAGVQPLNKTNLYNHKNHTSPQKLLQEVLTDRKKHDSAEGRALVRIIEEVTNEPLDKERIMEGMSRARLQDLADLEQMLVRNRSRWLEAQEKRYLSKTDLDELERLEGRLLSLVERRHALWTELHRLLLDEMKNSRDTMESKLRTEMYRIMVDSMRLHMRNFMQEMSDVVMSTEYFTSPERGVKFFQRLSKAMDRNLKPMFDEFSETGMVDATFEDLHDDKHA